MKIFRVKGVAEQEGAPGYENWIEYAFKAYVFADDPSRATALAEKQPGVKYVTSVEELEEVEHEGFLLYASKELHSTSREAN